MHLTTSLASPAIKASLVLTTLLAQAATAAPTITNTGTSPNPAAPLLTPHHQRDSDAATTTKRTCSSLQYPQLRTASAPDQPIPFSISIPANPSQVEIGFTIPSAAVGPCSLMISLPSDCGITGAGAQVNVYALDGPAAGALVGTTVFAAGTQATINSFACREQMCYGLEVASAAGGDDDGQGVGFVEMKGVGLSMTYDC